MTSQPGLYCPQEIIDFGLLPSTAQPRSVKLLLLNSGSKPIPVQNVIATPVTEAISFVDYRYPGYTVYVDEWLYDLGRNRFRRLLQFENGRLVRVDVRDKPQGLRPQP